MSSEVTEQTQSSEDKKKVDRLLELEDELTDLHIKSEQTVTEDTLGMNIDVDIPEVFVPTPIYGEIEDIRKHRGKAELDVRLSNQSTETFQLDWPDSPDEMNTENKLIRLLHLKDIPIKRFADLCGERVTVIPIESRQKPHLSIPNDNKPSRLIHKLFKPLFKYRILHYRRKGLAGPRKLRPTLIGSIIIALTGMVSGYTAWFVGASIPVESVSAFVMLLGVSVFAITSLALVLGIGIATLAGIIFAVKRTFGASWPF